MAGNKKVMTAFRLMVLALVAVILISGSFLALWRGYIYYPQEVTFSVNKKAYGPSEEIIIEFSKPLAPFGRQDFFVRIGNADLPDGFGHLQFLLKGAVNVKWNVPARPGSYKVVLGVRVYGRYARYLHREMIYVTEEPGQDVPAEEPVAKDLLVRFKLKSDVIHEDEFFYLYFSEPLNPREDENYDVTVSPMGSPDDEVWALMRQPDEGFTEFEARITHLPGRYEVRLIARWPYNMVVIDRKPVIIAPRDFDLKGYKFDLSPDADLKPTFKLKKTVITTVEKPFLVFSEPLVPRGMDVYSVSIVPADKNDVNWPREEVAPFAFEFEYSRYLAPGEYKVTLFTRRIDDEHKNILHAELLKVVSPGPEQAEDPQAAE